MDLLKVTGVDSKGYGKVYKVVMRDPKIPLCAKALYAYLCSYAGNGTTAFPKREKVMKDLQLAKNTFSKHLGILIDAKYIARTQTPAGNTYEILLRVPDKEGSQVEIKGKGYGTIPKFTMLDRRLSAQAKGVYAYFCSYAGAGNSAYPHRNTILRELNIGTTSYYRHYKDLVKLGYITPVQGTKGNGQFTATTYRLNEYLGQDPAQSRRKRPPDASEAPYDEQQEPHTDAEFDGVSQKALHGESDAVSQKALHGEKPHTDAKFCGVSQKAVHGDIVENFLPKNSVSQKQGYGEPVSRYLRHPYTNNTLTINIPSSYEEGKETINIAAPEAPDDHKPVYRPVFSKQDVNTAIGYQQLINEGIAWASLKNTLGHFTTPADREMFVEKYKQIVRETAIQFHYFLRRTEPSLIVDGRTYDYSVVRERLITRMNFDTVREFCAGIAERYQEIRSVKQYVRKAVINLAVQEYLDEVI